MSEISFPKITSITVPNSVTINSKFTIAVVVTETTVVIIPYEFFANDLYTGEV